MTSVLLSASVERCFVSRMRDFFCQFTPSGILKYYQSTPEANVDVMDSLRLPPSYLPLFAILAWGGLTVIHFLTAGTRYLILKYLF